MSDRLFRGDAFTNRYRIDFTLTTNSPFHLGTGEMIRNKQRLPISVKQDEEGDKEDPMFSLVASDAKGRAHIPGSSLKGAMHGWLQRLFAHLEEAGIGDLHGEKHYHPGEEKEEEMWKEDEAAKQHLSLLHLLFGSPRAAAKIDFWDAELAGEVKTPTPAKELNEALLHWDQTRQTVILKSVAIDPVRGTAADGKLYNFEAVPRGVRFQGSIVGQNLNEEELGMLLFALSGFNSQIYPVTLGAMAGRGFGRFECRINSIRRLGREHLKDWVATILESDKAGFELLAETSKLAAETEAAEEKIKAFKQAFVRRLEP